MKNKKDKVINLLAEVAGRVMCWNCPLAHERRSYDGCKALPESCSKEILAWAQRKAVQE